MLIIRPKSGYEVMQDVHGLGEKYGVFKPDFNSDVVAFCLSPFEPIPHLAHLQLLFAEEPYFGRTLRWMNEGAWWYRMQFAVPQDAPAHATLRIGAADYFADVYLNGEKLGSHEGYFAPFSFDVGEKLLRGQENTVVIRVSAPWDTQVMDGQTRTRFWDIERNQIKGTYEHADTFVQRDVNPIGLWGEVELVCYEAAKIQQVISHATLLDKGGALSVSCQLSGDAAGCAVKLTLCEADTGVQVAQADAADGAFSLTLPEVQAWQCIGHGKPALYTLNLTLVRDGKTLDTHTRRIGFRDVQLHRTADKTYYTLNGKRIFIRGTTYFPEIYQSAMCEARYRRDLALVMESGMNAVRIHVHVERPEFYDLCDELGLLVIQDTDLNWVHPRTEAFTERAVALCRTLFEMHGHHPSVVTWILYNEPDRGHDDYYMNVGPAPQLEVLAHEITPEITTIRGSYVDEALHSGDSHNYLGSLNGHDTHYLDTLKKPEKFNTEFGIDAPPCIENIRRIPAIAKRLTLSEADLEAIQTYQYRLLKFYIEHYRMHKYENMGGYVQFMFIDLCPQSYYGVLDWWGMVKPGYKALLESNQPILLALEHDTQAKALWVVNDTDDALEGTLRWVAVNEAGQVQDRGEQAVSIPEDGCVRICDYTKPLQGLTLTLQLIAADGTILAANQYVNPLCHPEHPEGHPHRVDAELGMRLFNA